MVSHKLNDHDCMEVLYIKHKEKLDTHRYNIITVLLARLVVDGNQHFQHFDSIHNN